MTPGPPEPPLDDQHGWERLVDLLLPGVWEAAAHPDLSEGDTAGVVHLAWLRLAQRLEQITDFGVAAEWLAGSARAEVVRLLASHPQVIRLDAPESVSSDQRSSDRRER